MLSYEDRENLIRTSKPAAAAFLEDMRLMREILSRDTTAAEARRLSAMLRRLLVERDLNMISAPRIGKMCIQAINNNPVYSAERKYPLLMFCSCYAKIFGNEITGVTLIDTNHFGLKLLQGAKKHPLGWDPKSRVDLKLDSFLTQRVIYLRGKWVSRSDAIKFVANVSHGVHSGTPSDESEMVLAQVSRANSFRHDGKGLSADLLKHGVDSTSADFTYTPGAIDPVLIEMICTAQLLCDSPDIVSLERIVSEELSQPHTS